MNINFSMKKKTQKLTEDTDQKLGANVDYYMPDLAAILRYGPIGRS